MPCNLLQGKETILIDNWNGARRVLEELSEVVENAQRRQEDYEQLRGKSKVKTRSWMQRLLGFNARFTT